MKDGRNFETIVAAIERVTDIDPTIKVQSPYYSTDRVTGSKREHDVGIILSRNRREIVIALECRDRSRKVTVNEVESFSHKCRDTGVHKGCIVSSKGFTEDAIVKAKHLDITCYSLEEVQDLSWLSMGTIDSCSLSIKSNNWVLIPQENLKVKPVKIHIEDSKGTRVELQQLDAAVKAEIDKRNDINRNVSGTYHFPYRFELSGFYLCDDESGVKHPLKHANVSVEVEIKVTPIMISKMLYKDEMNSVNVIEAGIAPIFGDGISGDLMFVSGSDGITVAFCPSPKNEK